MALSSCLPYIYLFTSCKADSLGKRQQLDRHPVEMLVLLAPAVCNGKHAVQKRCHGLVNRIALPPASDPDHCVVMLPYTPIYGTVWAALSMPGQHAPFVKGQHACKVANSV
jgi:hypothetical protein